MLVIFDLDGVLVDSRDIHFNCLNQALLRSGCEPIGRKEHLDRFDGLSTRVKLNLLLQEGRLREEQCPQVEKEKQDLTEEAYSSLQADLYLRGLFEELRDAGCQLAVASNSVRSSVDLVLSSLGVADLIDVSMSNEDVRYAKPSPHMYWKIAVEAGVHEDEVVILEDSAVGRAAASRSGFALFPVRNAKSLRRVSAKDILNALGRGRDMDTGKWEDRELNVLIPMAGLGSRFSDAGYTFPKPLIEFLGKPMIQHVVENLQIDARYIFLVNKEHSQTYRLVQMLKSLQPSALIVEVDGLTEGAACTALLARDLINSDKPLLIANSDQLIRWKVSETMFGFNDPEVDAGILTFQSSHPKWSFVKLGSDGYVTEVAEKNPISTHATVGIYFWQRGADFVESAEAMIREGDRVNGEFYIAPAFNYAIRKGLKVVAAPVKEMWGVGTPEDLNEFLRLNPNGLQ